MRKGYQYMTVVLDLDTGAVLYTALGKGQQALEGFFARLRRARAKLEAIAVDMSQAYASAITAYWPGEVAIVHDHYHVVANMNEVIDKVRRDEQNRLEGERKQFIKGARFESHIETILAWYEHPITSGPLEGLNNKIKVLKRSAYGYRDFAFFGLRLLFIHETKLQLTGA